METKNNNVFIKSDENRFINVTYIRWVQEINNCFEICNKSTGCAIRDGTHRVCKVNNPDSYKKIMDLIYPSSEE
jgi:hypothetical protein